MAGSADGWAGAARSLSGAALDWLYPPACLACGEDVGADGGLCPSCWRDMRWIEGAACPVCAAPFGFDAPAAGAPPCPDCGAGPRGWRRGAAACLYEGAGRALVLALKQGDRLDAARAMGAWMARAARPLLASDGGRPPLATPVPLHWTRRLGRRFNQSLELARAFSAAGGASLAPDLLRRTRRTPRQTGGDAAARRENMRGAFRLAPRAAALVAGRRLLLVDDVLTTGATLSEAAKVLNAAGAAAVDVIVFARAARDPLATGLSATTSRALETAGPSERASRDETS